MVQKKDRDTTPRKRKKKTVMKTRYNHTTKFVALFTVILAVIVGTAVIVLRDVDSVDINGSVQFTVFEGDSCDDVATALKDNGVIRYPLAFKIIARVGGYDQNIAPGIAVVQENMSYRDILDMLVMKNRANVTIEITAGMDSQQICEKLVENGLMTEEEFYEATDPSLYPQYRFLEDITERENRLEGYFYPATYEIPNSMKPQEIITLMLDTFDKQFVSEYYDKCAEFSMSVDQVISLASIVERETSNKDAKADVATVFYNRKNNGKKLQAGSTVQYILGVRKPTLLTSDTESDSLYNTFVYEGYPIGPICSPGIDSIMAVLYPSVNYYEYHAETTDGEDVFAFTKDEFISKMNGKQAKIAFDFSILD